MIYCGYPKAQYEKYSEEINAAISRVLSSERYILGSEVSSFESEFASYIGIKNAIAVKSGTDALFLALTAFNIGSGDEVIVPSHTASATLAAIKMTGANPVFLDIDNDYYTIDPTLIEHAITENTKAIIVVHLYGQSAELDEINSIAKSKNLILIEDCAQAHGTRWNKMHVGTFGDIGCFSFFPTKNLGAIGDGGAIVTNNNEIADRIRKLQQYGWNKKRISIEKGFNSRLDEIQAAILRVKLQYLNEDILCRIKIAEKYNENLNISSITRPKVRANSTHSHHLYVIQIEERDQLLEHLKQNGILASIHYPVACHQMPAFSEKKLHSLENTERIVSRILSLPVYPELTGNKAPGAVAFFSQ